MNIVRRGYRVFRNEGPLAFLAAGVAYLQSRLPAAETSRLSVRVLEYFASNHATLKVAGLEARFGTPTRDFFPHDFNTEETVIESFVGDLREGDVVYDIGANVGLYSVFAGRRLGEAGTVVAVEPNPVPVRYLYQNLEANCEDYHLISLAPRWATSVAGPP